MKNKSLFTFVSRRNEKKKKTKNLIFERILLFNIATMDEKEVYNHLLDNYL